MIFTRGKVLVSAQPMASPSTNRKERPRAADAKDRPRTTNAQQRKHAKQTSDAEQAVRADGTGHAAPAPPVWRPLNARPAATDLRDNEGWEKRSTRPGAPQSLVNCLQLFGFSAW